MSFEIVRNARIEAASIFPEGAKTPQLKILINGSHEHVFNSRSAESKLLEFMTEDDVSALLSGGTFVVIDGLLADYRKSDYTGFIHDERGVANLIEHVGATIDRPGRFSRSVAGSSALFNRHRRNTLSKALALGGNHHEFAISAEEFGMGGDFKAQLRYVWNPFNAAVSSIVEVERLICSNGMVGMAPLINSEVPIINNFEEHLAIASVQIEHKFRRVMVDRLNEMGQRRANLYDLTYIARAARSRMDNQNLTQDMIERLQQINQIANPRMHLDGYYPADIFRNDDKLKILDGHLSEFDAWNLLTEMDSHTHDNGEYGSDRIQRKINALVFDTNKDNHRRAVTPTAPLSRYSDHEKAFFAALKG